MKLEFTFDRITWRNNLFNFHFNLLYLRLIKALITASLVSSMLWCIFSLSELSAMVPEYWLTEGGQSATGALLDHIIENHAASARLANQAATQSKIFSSTSLILRNVLTRLLLYVIFQRFHCLSFWTRCWKQWWLSWTYPLLQPWLKMYMFFLTSMGIGIWQWTTAFLLSCHSGFK